MRSPDRRVLAVGLLLRAVTFSLMFIFAVQATFPAPLHAQANQLVSTDDEVELELRIAIGGGASQQWQGRIELTQGELSLVRVLGLEPDTPAAVQVADNRLRLVQRSPRSYDGLDVAIRAPRGAELVVELVASGEPKRVQIPLQDLITGKHESSLDEQQNRLLVRRVPGDKLRIAIDRSSLVFETGETLRFSVAPHEAGLPSDTALKCRVRLLGAADAEIWTGEADFRIDRSGAPAELGPFECLLPESEGVYRVVVEIVQPPRLGVALVRTKPLLSRDMQLVAIAPTRSEVTPKSFETLIEIDPAHPGWLERLTRYTKLGSIPGFAQEPLSNGKVTTASRLDTALVQLATGAWQAYPLPVKQLGQPHILEVEYPSDAPQVLGISLVEPNAAGQIVPISVDSGVEVTEVTVSGEKKLLKHRLVFWPRTRTPLVLLTNRHAKHTAWFGKLRVLHGPTELPHVTRPVDSGSTRLLAAYYDKPLFAENFNVSDALDAPSGRTFDDWNTFFLGAKRLIEELKYAGYNGAMISVMCEGSTIYPSQLLEPTPKYDMGTFFANGQDPLRKDVLEMLFRLFDREGLQLVPAMQFSTPLVELEAHRLRDPETIGLDLIGADGRPWLVSRGARRGLAPYYNPLDDRVQLAMRQAVDEVSERYAHHPAFAGIALQLSPETYAQLPGEDWCYDLRTTERFAREMKRSLASSGPTQHAERVRQLQTTEREAWLAWRAERLTALYASIERDLIRRRGSARLYLAGGEMFHSETLLRSMRPKLPSNSSVQEALLGIGLDPQLLRGETNIVMLRPQRQFAPAPIAAKGSHLELNRSHELDELLAKAGNVGVHFFHEPATLRLPEFDSVSPTGKANSHLFMASQILPSGHENRRRFAQSLAASDLQTMIDGGWMLPLGQEAAVRGLFSVYRALPCLAFELVESDSVNSLPIVCRKAQERGATYFYFVNTSPSPQRIEVEISDANHNSLSRLGDGPALEPLHFVGDIATLTIELAPYDVQAFTSPSSRMQVNAWKGVATKVATDGLRQQVDQLRGRAIALRNIKPMEVLPNADFEQATNKTPIPGWVHATDKGLTFALDSVDARDKQALHIKSAGAVAWLRSDAFAPPTTGRISVWVWIRTKDPQNQPALRLAIEANHRDKTYYRFATVGAGKNAPALKAEWSPYLFQVDDLPTSDLSDLRVGFDLMSAGEIWIDDVQVFDMHFHEHEQHELLKTIAGADLLLGKGHVADCQSVLEGYWPRFLMEHVPLEATRIAGQPVTKPEESATKSKAEETPATSMRDRMWNWMPKWR